MMMELSLSFKLHISLCLSASFVLIVDFRDGLGRCFRGAAGWMIFLFFKKSVGVVFFCSPTTQTATERVLTILGYTAFYND